MSRRGDWLARTLFDALFLTGTCIILPMILFRHVSAVLSAWPGGPLA